MKAKQRTLGVLLFLILLAGGVFALLTLRNAREEQAASAAADGTIPLAAVSGNDLTQIVLHYQGETNTLLYTADGWTLAKIPLTIWTPPAATRCSPRFLFEPQSGSCSPRREDYGFAGACADHRGDGSGRNGHLYLRDQQYHDRGSLCPQE